MGTGRPLNSPLSLARSREGCRIECSSAVARVSSETRTGKGAAAGDDGAVGLCSDDLIIARNASGGGVHERAPGKQLLPSVYSRKLCSHELALLWPQA